MLFGIIALMLVATPVLAGIDAGVFPAHCVAQSDQDEDKSNTDENESASTDEEEEEEPDCD